MKKQKEVHRDLLGEKESQSCELDRERRKCDENVEMEKDLQA